MWAVELVAGLERIGHGSGYGRLRAFQNVMNYLGRPFPADAVAVALSVQHGATVGD